MTTRVLQNLACTKYQKGKINIRKEEARDREEGATHKRMQHLTGSISEILRGAMKVKYNYGSNIIDTFLIGQEKVP